ncbi:hypothetical protein [Arthrobacter sp. UNC362MFTsu5.1]|uniref:hypothetical protein n=1 Tax=Arthrobacter sp. UNC362MFTsu5.1 TaxID=1449044 RepID=UPI00068F456B|nr:hypothetical protein [Arthrobacter sp. UNC362MFTsu5.1]
MSTEHPIPAHTPEASAAAGTMPLGARRLLIIGGLLIPVGMLMGPYILMAQILAPAGVALIAVALSYQTGARWFSRLSWATAVAGGLWVAAIAAYYATIMIAADASAPLPPSAQVLFITGTVFFAAMAAAFLAAMIIRITKTRATKR